MWYQILILFLNTIINAKAHDYEEKKDFYDSFPYYELPKPDCQKFINNTNFNESLLLNVTWRLFFAWSPEMEPGEHYFVFNKPMKSILERYNLIIKEENITMDLSDAQLFMETSHEFSALLLKTPNNGMYTSISAEMLTTSKVEKVAIAMKLVSESDDHYLSILNCNNSLALALTHEDKMPDKQKLQEVIKLIDYRSDFNYSYYDFNETKGPEVSVGNQTTFDNEANPYAYDTELLEGEVSLI